jgi:hypothetical protein
VDCKRGRSGVGQSEGAGRGLAGGNLAKLDQAAGKEVTCDGECALAFAEALYVAKTVDGRPAVVDGALREQCSGDVAVRERKKGDGEAAAAAGLENRAGRIDEDELSREGDRKSDVLRGEVVDEKLARQSACPGRIWRPLSSEV